VRTERRRAALYLSDACAFTIGEAESYVRKKLRDGTFSEDPEKKNDHAMDALRYAVAQIARST
jgi:phage terminase large subunit